MTRPYLDFSSGSGTVRSVDLTKSQIVLRAATGKFPVWPITNIVGASGTGWRFAEASSLSFHEEKGHTKKVIEKACGQLDLATLAACSPRAAVMVLRLPDVREIIRIRELVR